MRKLKVSIRTRGTALRLAWAAGCLLTAGSAAAATITVTGTGNTVAVDGLVTLREAITSINNGANVNADVVAIGAYGTADTIRFAIGSGVQTISPSPSQLPALNVPAVIDATTQPGFAGTPLIVLDGVGAGPFSRGLTLNAGGSTVRGLVIDRFFFGIELAIIGGNTVAGNFIGIDQTGTVARSNTSQGVVITGGNANVIGGATLADRNVISGNPNAGMQINTSGNIVQGNFIGTNSAGTAAVANGVALDVFGPNTVIGGTVGTTPGGPCTGACNLISGNQVGPQIDGGASGAQIQGNLMGTNAAGTGAIPNVSAGLVLNDSNANVGGTVAAARNVIAFNSAEGVQVPGGTGNSILGNSIFGNGALGIDLGGTGVTPNDPGDADTGPNNLQNFPVITSATVTAGVATIAGTLNSTANTTFRIEFFSNAACDPSGNGEGQSFIGFTGVTTNGSGNATFGPLVFLVPAAQSVITATATDPANNTSEFSACLGVILPTATPTATPTVTATPPGPPATPTPTATSGPAPTATPTPTSIAGPGAVVVPTLSGWMLAFLGLSLAAAGFALMRRL